MAYNSGKFKSWKRKHKNIRNLFRLKKELNDTGINIGHLFRLE